MENILIRPANENDLPALYDLYLEFHEFHARHLPRYLYSLGVPNGQDKETLLSRIRDVIMTGDSTILLAEINGESIGLAEIHLKNPDASNIGATPVRYAHLQSLAVTERFRFKGVGKLLLQAAQGWAVDNGAKEMRLDIWEFSAGPLLYYDKLGYQTIRRSLAKDL